MSGERGVSAGSNLEKRLPVCTAAGGDPESDFLGRLVDEAPLQGPIDGRKVRPRCSLVSVRLPHRQEHARIHLHACATSPDWPTPAAASLGEGASQWLSPTHASPTGFLLRVRCIER